MSADNWATCPQCLAAATAARDEAIDAAAALYGKATAQEYEAARTAAASIDVREEQFTTFREDYAIYGAKSGTVNVSYSGHCDVCRLSLNFKQEHPFFPSRGVV